MGLCACLIRKTNTHFPAIFRPTQSKRRVAVFLGPEIPVGEQEQYPGGGGRMWLPSAHQGLLHKDSPGTKLYLHL